MDDNKPNLPDPERIATLIARFIQKRLTKKERKELDEWVSASERNVQLFEELTNPNKIKQALEEYNRGITRDRLN